MHPIPLISALCAAAILSAGATAWASASDAAWVWMVPNAPQQQY